MILKSPIGTYMWLPPKVTFMKLPSAPTCCNRRFSLRVTDAGEKRDGRGGWR